ncbi:unnamed protein product, partial [Urochloa humidicola]
GKYNASSFAVDERTHFAETPLRSGTRQRVVASLIYGFVSCSKDRSSTRRPLYQALRGDGGGGDPVRTREVHAHRRFAPKDCSPMSRQAQSTKEAAVAARDLLKVDVARARKAGAAPKRKFAAAAALQKAPAVPMRKDAAAATPPRPFLPSRRRRRRCCSRRLRRPAAMPSNKTFRIKKKLGSWPRSSARTAPSPTGPSGSVVRATESTSCCFS